MVSFYSTANGANVDPMSKLCTTITLFSEGEDDDILWKT
jgi:hypothetical protein